MFCLSEFGQIGPRRGGERKAKYQTGYGGARGSPLPLVLRHALSPLQGVIPRPLCPLVAYLALNPLDTRVFAVALGRIPGTTSRIKICPQSMVVILQTASPTYSSVLYAWGWKFGSTAPDSAARLPAVPGFLCTFSGLPFGPRPLPGPAPSPIVTPTSPPTIPLPLLAVPPPLDRCSAAPAHRLPHPLPSHPFAAPAVPCAPPAPPARYSAVPARP
ncbi:hypothetical protein B0H14DRAFT_2611794 [Mycena olivaceomarginata]|nr:hypothetical protein B0H14DRAFT_2611794 [Mycena olivaceomarginata]